MSNQNAAFSFESFDFGGAGTGGDEFSALLTSLRQEATENAPGPHAALAHNALNGKHLTVDVRSIANTMLRNRKAADAISVLAQARIDKRPNQTGQLIPNIGEVGGRNIDNSHHDIAIIVGTRTAEPIPMPAARFHHQPAPRPNSMAAIVPLLVGNYLAAAVRNDGQLLFFVYTVSGYFPATQKDLDSTLASIQEGRQARNRGGRGRQDEDQSPVVLKPENYLGVNLLLQGVGSISANEDPKVQIISGVDSEGRVRITTMMKRVLDRINKVNYGPTSVVLETVIPLKGDRTSDARVDRSIATSAHVDIRDLASAYRHAMSSNREAMATAKKINIDGKEVDVSVRPAYSSAHVEQFSDNGRTGHQIIIEVPAIPSVANMVDYSFEADIIDDKDVHQLLELLPFLSRTGVTDHASFLKWWDKESGNEGIASVYVASQTHVGYGL